jgi:hypothetical protein
VTPTGNDEGAIVGSETAASSQQASRGSRRLGPFGPLLEPHVARGFLGVLLTFLALGSMHLFAIPPFAAG